MEVKRAHVKILQKVYDNNSFYKRKIEDEDFEFGESFSQKDFECLPLLEKEELAGDALRIMFPEYIPKLYRKELMPFHTSGSTGKCLELYWDVSDFRRALYPLWFYRRKFYGIYTWDKHCKFYTLYQAGSEEPWMREYQPVWLLLQPCIAELLCLVQKKYELKKIHSVKYVECIGEMLSEELHARIEECSLGR